MAKYRVVVIGKKERIMTRPLTRKSAEKLVREIRTKSPRNVRVRILKMRGRR